MSDIRLEEIPFEIDGMTWQLRCNMNVLADVQEAYDGRIGDALSATGTLKSVLVFLAAMLNDYADEMGWPQHYTAKELGRRLRQWEIPINEIMGLVTRSIVPPSQDEEVSTPDTEEESPDPSGN